jgi:hypothetical protein
VSMETHVGFKGILSSSIGDMAPYYGDLQTEVIFHSPSLCRGGGTMSRKESKEMVSHSHSNSMDSILAPLPVAPDNEVSSSDFFLEKMQKRRVA